MHPVLKEIQLLGIVPVVVIDDEGDAEPLARALLEAGLPCAEVTFRTAAALRALERMRSFTPRILLGAGTVHSVEQAKSAVASGASFIVSPGLNRKVAEYCLSEGIPVTPGVATPTEAGTALEMGLEVVKFFPAEALGGVDYLKAMSAPFGQMQFIPTGGIEETNLLAYLKLPSVLACGGSWMLKRELIRKKAFDEIRSLCTRAMAVVLGLRVLRTAPGEGTDDITRRRTESLGSRLGMHIGSDEMCVPGSRVDTVRKKLGGSSEGDLFICTNFIERAMEYCRRCGIEVRGGTLVKEEGKLVSAQLEVDTPGGRVHLVQA